MTTKTLKIAQELHDALKLKALQERRTLQDVTEEILENAFRSQDKQTGQRADADKQQTTDKEND